MRIKLLPQRREDSLNVNKTGHILTINGEDFDFSSMTEGATLPRAAIASEWFSGDVDMTNSELIVTLLLPLPANYSHEQAFPQDLVAVPDGAVVFPSALPEPSTEEDTV